MRPAIAFAAVLVGALAAPAAATETPSHGLSAFGDLKYPPDFTHFDYVNPDAPKGGEIRLRPSIATRTFDSFNPFVVKGDGADGASLLLFDRLMTPAHDEPDAFYGLLAKTATLAADKSWVAFELRPEARFADGSPVTAEDVAWSLTTLRDEGSPVYALILADVAEVTTDGPHKLRVSFAEGGATRDLPRLVASMPIFSKAFFETRSFTEPTVDEPPLGSGPYRVGAVAQGRSVTYERRDDYWAADLPAMRGRFNFDKITFEYFSDNDLALQALSAGAFDFNEEFSSVSWATKYEFPQIEQGLLKREVISDGRPGGTQGYWFNTRRAKFADPRTREALAMAFDFEWSNRTLFYGLYQRTDSLFEGSLDLEAEGEPGDAEVALLNPFRDVIEPAAFGAAPVPPETDASGNNRRNLRRARRLLEEAGWRLVNGKIVDADGEPLTIEFLDRSASGFDRITRPLIENLETLGVEATIRAVDFAQFERRRVAFDFDVMVARFVFDATPGRALRGVLHSSSADADGSQNLAGVKSPAIDALIEAMEAATSREELRAAARALDRVFRAGHYWIPNWTKASHTIAYWDRFGRPEDLGIPKPPYDRGVIETWWLDPAKNAAIDAARGG